ncbi:MAG: CoA transferase, partial [Actinomycetia bacterium]|nr:CoA transferase [Actinomycetes bacterium]
VPQFESIVAAIGDQLLASQLGESTPPPPAEVGPGNRDPALAPQGVYRCQGEDQWVAVSVVSDDGWRALCHLTGFPAGWTTWLLDDRQHHHDMIDDALSTWTRDRRATEVAELLQREGTAAGAVHDAAGLMADPHLDQRALFTTFDQPEFGPFTTANLPLHLTTTPARIRRRAPLLGEHNH